MSDLTFLRMPEHPAPMPSTDGQDFYADGKGIVCRSWLVPGYALQMPDGRLHCNRCGWVTPKPVVTVWSHDTDRTYLTFDDLVKEEANGWMVVATVTKGKRSWPWSVGPFEDRAEANRVRVNSRNRAKREQQRGETPKDLTFSFSVTPAWKKF